jgi:hypothetical protein
MAKKAKKKVLPKKKKAAVPKKRVGGRKLDKGDTTYTPEMAERVREVILAIKPLKDNGSLHLSRVAKVMGIPQRTFSYWTDPDGKYFHLEFAEALADAHEECRELIDLGKTKRAMIAKSQPYTRKKITRELRVSGPKMPGLSKMRKAELLKFAVKTLKLTVAPKATVNDLKLLIVQAVQESTTEKLVVVKEETERMRGDVAAGRMVTSNIGPKDKRWNEKSEVDVNATSLVDAIAKAGIQKK